MPDFNIAGVVIGTLFAIVATWYLISSLYKDWRKQRFHNEKGEDPPRDDKT